jgi:folate-dependent phosphoribosylglycinamide formyltransferase PurN
MTRHKIVAITGNQLAHNYFLNQLRTNFELSAIFIEKKRYPDPTFNSGKEREAWEDFFINRTKTEESLFRFSKFNNLQNSPKNFIVEKGCLNDHKTIKLINKFNPTVIVIFGTSLLSSKYLELYPNQILNLHVGLSQYYRGSSCNFWPIYNLEPQLLGATIHYVTNTIDGGNVLFQDSTELHKSDSQFVLMTKPIILGTKLMVEAIKRTSDNLTNQNRTQSNGKLYQIKDFVPKSIIHVNHLVSSGKIKRKIEQENFKLE